MDRRVIDYLERRMRVSRDNANQGDRRDYDRRGGDMARGGGDRRDYDMDERRGVRGTGPYGIGGRRYQGRDRRDGDYDYDRRDYADNARGGGRDSRDYDYRDYDYDNRRGGGDRRDYDYDYADYGHQEMKLTKEDMHRWKQKLQNADGTQGEHFDMQQIMHVVEKLGVKMSGYDEKELCLVVNMLYSDYCKVIKKYVPAEKELMAYVEMAKAFLEDADGPKPAEKLALYYFCIADNEEV